MEQKATKPDPKTLERYRQQMLEMYHPQLTKDDEWFNQQFPEPQRIFETASATAPSSTTETIPEEDSSAPPIAETPFIGYLRVFVATAEGAQPISDALITVTRDGVIYANTVTDQDGYTQVIPLPSVDPVLTLTPGNATPFRTYDIQISADGFQSVRYNSVPVYGNNYVTQPTALHPLLYNDDPDTLQEIISGGPENL